MNCLAHAYRYLNDPYFAAGCCVPDWLGMIDRRVRIRQKELDATMSNLESDSQTIAIARGVRKHLDDDAAFHHSAAFINTCREVTLIIREHGTYGSAHMPGFVGHILVELLLDASIETSSPGILKEYYRTIESICPEQLARSVNDIASKTTDHLPLFLQRYLSERFLFDYLADERLLLRLNRVLGRVSFQPLPNSFVEVIAQARSMVERRQSALLECLET
jgi:hypothetical protein